MIFELQRRSVKVKRRKKSLRRERFAFDRCCICVVYRIGSEVALSGEVINIGCPERPEWR